MSTKAWASARPQRSTHMHATATLSTDGILEEPVAAPRRDLPSTGPAVGVAGASRGADTSPNAPCHRQATLALGGRRVALLFGGWTDEIHINELEYLYRVLSGPIYKYPASDITVLNYDGRLNYHFHFSLRPRGISWPGDNTPYRMRIDGPGTTQHIGKVFTHWSGPGLTGGLGSEDSVFLFLTGNVHRAGERGPETSLRCYPESIHMPASRIASLVATLPPIRQLMVLAQTEHSADFIEPILRASPARETSVAAASSGPIPTHNGSSQRVFSPFSQAWISALNGCEPDGVSPLRNEVDRNGAHGVVTAYHAYDYARSAAPDSRPVFGANSPKAGQMNLL